jgi:predicted butyrate kinase (DUF1464 family)
MTRTIGIDPGTVSFDVCGLDDGQVFLDTTLPSPEFAANPQALIDLLQSAKPVDLIIAPSGYGLPLVPIEQFGDQERFLFTLVDERERGRIPVLGGMGKMIPLMKASQLPILFMPGVIHLPTVPEHRRLTIWTWHSRYLLPWHWVFTIRPATNKSSATSFICLAEVEPAHSSWPWMAAR